MEMVYIVVLGLMYIVVWIPAFRGHSKRLRRLERIFASGRDTVEKIRKPREPESKLPLELRTQLGEAQTALMNARHKNSTHPHKWHLAELRHCEKRYDKLCEEAKEFLKVDRIQRPHYLQDGTEITALGDLQYISEE